MVEQTLIDGEMLVKVNARLSELTAENARLREAIGKALLGGPHCHKASRIVRGNWAVVLVCDARSFPAEKRCPRYEPRAYNPTPTDFDCKHAQNGMSDLCDLMDVNA